MASSGSAFPLLLIVLSLLAASAAARPGVPFHPCNTVFISYTISTTTDAALSGNNRPNGFVSVYRIITPVRTTFHSDPRSAMIPRPGLLLPRREVAPAEPAPFGFSSLRDRAKDILVVVIGLLFGVGCGALTAATMYLAWSLVAHRHEICGSDGYSDEEGDVKGSAKKAGYVKIPPADPVSGKEGIICRVYLSSLFRYLAAGSAELCIDHKIVCRVKDLLEMDTL
ncbi:hypothetical protein C4D60_Mb11t01480 [Musa balbisiana]|uniref:Uncharacterized protein n=1 Tax=Musa balbisiana TaxID=52838 RepID=A0A4S8J100_MUSBA|nr:hypothetical protein C4D60_Mb11t01480 [Musa balbisiana]